MKQHPIDLVVQLNSPGMVDNILRDINSLPEKKEPFKVTYWGEDVSIFTDSILKLMFGKCL